MKARQRRKLARARITDPDFQSRVEAKLDMLLDHAQTSDRRSAMIGAASGAVAGGITGGAVAFFVEYAKGILFGVQ